MSYSKLESIFHEINILEDTLGILGWDTSVMMPAGAQATRAEQIALISKLRHQKLKDLKLRELVEDAENESLNDWQKANLKLIKKVITEASLIDDKLIEELNKASIKSEVAWRQARQDNDYAMLLPHLQEVYGLVLEVAQAKAEHYDISTYEAMLSDYDLGLKESKLDEVFNVLESEVPNIISKIQDKQTYTRPNLLGIFPISKQQGLAKRIMKDMGFDFDRGRLDTSAHPFCGGGLNDIRITTSYEDNEVVNGLLGIIHETGHALYEMGRPKEWETQRVGSSAGMSIHESQSLFWELQIARSPEFITYLHKHLIKEFNLDTKKFSHDNLQRGINFVEPSLIRIEADEVTYPLHVTLRYKLEKALVYNELTLKDLPAAWNELMTKLLGITPPNDRLGVLQDIHWPMGSFGYFPTYALGEIIAAQIKYKVIKEMPDLYSRVENGDFLGIKNWLNSNIHALGSLYQTDDLVKKVTGENINPNYLISHFKERYL